jgi:hypothetical protein
MWLRKCQCHSGQEPFLPIGEPIPASTKPLYIGVHVGDNNKMTPRPG